MKKMRLFMLLFLLMVCLSGIASAQGWEWITSSDKVGYYYSRGTAARLNDNRQAGESGHVKAWFKFQYEDENDRQDMIRCIKHDIENGTAEKKSGNPYDFYYVILQTEYKNVRETIYGRDLRLVLYDHAGNVITEDHKADHWKVVIPDSIDMTMYEYILARAK